MIVAKRALAAAALSYSGLARLLRRVKAWSGIIVLAYHRVCDGHSTVFDPGVWSATPEVFEHQVRFVSRHCDVIGPDEIVNCLEARGRRFVLFTFDDGYRDNYHHAFRILRENSVRAVFFVCTGFVDSRQLAWWDEIAWMLGNSRTTEIAPNQWLPHPVPLRASPSDAALTTLLRRYKTLDGNLTNDYMDFLGQTLGCGRYRGSADDMWMTWDMLREMHNAGMCIGGHTANHPILSRLSAPQQFLELEQCKSRIEAEIDTRMTCVSYPVGGRDSFNAETRSCITQLGIPLAFSYYGGYTIPPNIDPLDIPRIAVERDTSAPLFRAMLTLPQVFS